MDRDTIHYRLVCMALQLLNGNLQARIDAIDKYTDIIMKDVKKAEVKDRRAPQIIKFEC